MALNKPKLTSSKSVSAKKQAKPSANHASKPFTAPQPAQAPTPQLPLDLQQLLLNIFRISFADRLGSDLHPLLQEVKQHLYNRDFARAFGRADYLEAYAARWSPSRALGYLRIFDDVVPYLPQLGDGATPETSGNGERRRELKVVCIGGGAGAEMVALGGLHQLMSRRNTLSKGEEEEEEETVDDPSPLRLKIHALDIADWTPVVHALQERITTAPPLSAYASAATKAANKPVVPSSAFHLSFQQMDVLNPSGGLAASVPDDADLVTLMFTLNELYTTSLALTQQFLHSLTACLKSGTLLLVVDSPGSYSSVPLNGGERKYPMHWLVDHTLMKSDRAEEARAIGSDKHQSEDRLEGATARWVKLVSEESRWFRLPEGLKYPIELENMRFQMHLYRRL